MSEKDPEDAQKPLNEREEEFCAESSDNAPQSLKERARRGSKERFKEALQKVRDVEPEPFDKL